jgi:c-di-GMP-binding flagellar brake protein YcgR
VNYLETSTINTQTAPPDRRRNPRIQIGVPVEFKTEAASAASHTQTSDLSLGGCYLEMNFTLPVGTEVEMVLWLDDERVEARARVATHHPSFGNGLCFIRMRAEDQRKLEKFVNRHSE